MRPLIILLSVSVLFFSCEEEKLGQVELLIDHYEATAFWPWESHVMRMQEDGEIGSDKWHFISNIEGFEYEKGFIYRLEAKKFEIKDPPEDASSIRYELKEVISKEPVALETTFSVTITAPGGQFVYGNLDDGYTLLGEININCNALCDEFISHLDSEQFIHGIFRHDGPTGYEYVGFSED